MLSAYTTPKAEATTKVASVQGSGEGSSTGEDAKEDKEDKEDEDGKEDEDEEASSSSASASFTKEEAREVIKEWAAAQSNVGSVPAAKDGTAVESEPAAADAADGTRSAAPSPKRSAAPVAHLVDRFPAEKGGAAKSSTAARSTEPKPKPKTKTKVSIPKRARATLKSRDETQFNLKRGRTRAIAASAGVPGTRASLVASYNRDCTAFMKEFARQAVAFERWGGGRKTVTLGGAQYVLKRMGHQLYM